MSSRFLHFETTAQAAAFIDQYLGKAFKLTGGSCLTIQKARKFGGGGTVDYENAAGPSNAVPSAPAPAQYAHTLTETADHYYVYFVAPGFDKSHLTITIDRDDKTINISAPLGYPAMMGRVVRDNLPQNLALSCQLPAPIDAAARVKRILQNLDDDDTASESSLELQELEVSPELEWVKLSASRLAETWNVEICGVNVHALAHRIQIRLCSDVEFAKNACDRKHPFEYLCLLLTNNRLRLRSFFENGAKNVRKGMIDYRLVASATEGLRELVQEFLQAVENGARFFEPTSRESNLMRERFLLASILPYVGCDTPLPTCEADVMAKYLLFYRRDNQYPGNPAVSGDYGLF
ncbi:hypothetical protein HDU86_001329 [Geranomyces michiganensis]|nr:hypothetical protein HDU86_001329 [Geranomyces michiganensis]